MSLEKHKQEKHKPEFPLLAKIFKDDHSALLRLQSVLSSEEMEKIERNLRQESWDAQYIPSLLQEADKRIAKRADGMRMAA